MPPLVVPNSLFVSVRGLHLGRQWANVHGVSADGPIDMDQATAESVASPFVTFYNGMEALCSNDWSVTEIIVQDLQSASAPSYEIDPGTIVGTQTEPNLPPNLAICVTHRTALRGRSYRGRTFLAGFTEEANDGDGQISSTWQSNITTLFSQLRANLQGLSAGEFHHSVVSRKLATAIKVDSSTVNPLWDHQDRRK